MLKIKSCPDVASTVSALKVMFSQSIQKFTKYFGYFCKKLKNKNHQKVLKIAQSGHTAHDVRDNKDRFRDQKIIYFICHIQCDPFHIIGPSLIYWPMAKDLESMS